MTARGVRAIRVLVLAGTMLLSGGYAGVWHENWWEQIYAKP